MQAPQPKALGKVYLIGPISGDPHSLSSHTVRCLAQAHVVLYDRLVPPLPTDDLCPSAELFSLQSPAIPTDYPAWFHREVVTRLILTAEAGKIAVHLKAISPEQCVQGINELEVLREGGIAVEVISEGTESASSSNPLQETAACIPGALWGQRVLVTRPLGQSVELLAQLRALGAAPTVQPAIEIAPPPTWEPVDRALMQLDRFDWLVFSSVNGVDYLLERLNKLGLDLRCLKSLRLAAIGPSTAERLRQRGLEVTAVPQQYRAESLADLLAEQGAGKRFLLARASRGREVLAERLRAAGATVEQVVVYTSRDVEQPEPAVASMFQAKQFDWVTVTSSAIARSLHAMLGSDLDRARLASISPVTSATLRELGHEPAVEAQEYTTEGLILAMLEGSQPKA